MDVQTGYPPVLACSLEMDVVANNKFQNSRIFDHLKCSLLNASRSTGRGYVRTVYIYRTAVSMHLYTSK